MYHSNKNCLCLDTYSYLLKRGLPKLQSANYGHSASMTRIHEVDILVFLSIQSDPSYKHRQNITLPALQQVWECNFGTTYNCQKHPHRHGCTRVSDARIPRGWPAGHGHQWHRAWCHVKTRAACLWLHPQSHCSPQGRGCPVLLTRLIFNQSRHSCLNRGSHASNSGGMARSTYLTKHTAVYKPILRSISPARAPAMSKTLQDTQCHLRKRAKRSTVSISHSHLWGSDVPG